MELPCDSCMDIDPPPAYKHPAWTLNLLPYIHMYILHLLTVFTNVNPSCPLRWVLCVRTLQLANMLHC